MMYYQDGRSALHAAAQNGHHDTVKLLLDSGDDIHTTDKVSNIVYMSCCNSD